MTQTAFNFTRRLNRELHTGRPEPRPDLTSPTITAELLEEKLLLYEQKFDFSGSNLVSPHRAVRRNLEPGTQSSVFGYISERKPERKIKSV